MKGALDELQLFTLLQVTLILQRVCQFDLDKKEESPEKLLKSLLNTQLLNKVKNVISGTKLGECLFSVQESALLLDASTGWQIVERPLDIRVSCEYSVI